MMKITQWLGCFFSLLGAFLLALNCQYSGWGFVAFLAANICWIIYAWIGRVPGLMLQNLGFLATSLIGIYNYFFAV